MKNDNKSPKHPCQNCVYFDVCGEHTRTEPCKGRQTKTDVKKSQQTPDRRVYESFK